MIKICEFLIDPNTVDENGNATISFSKNSKYKGYKITINITNATVDYNKVNCFLICDEQFQRYTIFNDKGKSQNVTFDELRYIMRGEL